jgi:mono/diheme cytochrome c family protein
MVRFPLAKSLGAAVAAAFVTLSVPAHAEADAKTVRMFKAKCATCHGVDGKGDTDQGKKLAAKDLTSAEVQKLSDADWKKAISEGKKAEGKTEGMDAFKDKLESEQIDTLIAYVRTLKK